MCIAKLFEIQQELIRERKGLKQPDVAEVKPLLCLLLHRGEKQSWDY
jgi:hypothetical protein